MQVKTAAIVERPEDFIKDPYVSEFLNCLIATRSTKEIWNGQSLLPAEFEFDDDHSYFMVRLPVHPEEGTL